MQRQTQDNSRQLFKANHYGSIRALGTFSDLVLSESVYPRSSVTPLHSHDVDCLALFTAGSFREEFKRSSLHCLRGTVLFRPAGEVHRDHVGPKGARCLIIELPKSFAGRMNEAGVRLDAPMQAHDLENIFARVYRECGLGDELSALVMDSLVVEITCDLFRTQQPGAKPPRWLKLAHDYLRANFRATISLSDVADAVGIHPAHMARAYRQHYGYTMGEHVRQLRVSYACEQLRSDNSNLVLVALASGFSDQAHFCRVFKAMTGFTPGQYRRFRGMQLTDNFARNVKDPNGSFR